MSSMNQFDKEMDQFDKEFERMRRVAFRVWLVGATLTLTIIGVLGWVGYKILAHFGIL